MAALAGKSYSAEAIHDLLVTVFEESEARTRRRIALDLDATAVPAHSGLAKRSFHRYYNQYC
jgi:hypothetical protein